VPGLLKEKVQAYAKAMPQRLRHKLGPLADFAQGFAAAVPPSDTPLAPLTGTGVALSVAPPLPSCPSAPFPQANKVPSSFTAML